MIIFQKSRTPFIFRVIGVLLHPGILLVSGFATGLGYLALHEETSIRYGMFFAFSLLAGLCAFMIYSAIREAVTRLVEVSLTSGGLRVVELHYDTVVETDIPKEELQLKFNKHLSTSRMKYGGRSTGRSRISWSLDIEGKKGVSFTLRDKREALAHIVEKIQESGAVQLNANELDFLREFKSVQSVYRLAGVAGTAIWIVLGAATAYSAYRFFQGKGEWSFVFETPKGASLSGYWRIESDGQALGTVVLGQDSTLNENVFYQHGRWDYQLSDSTGEPSAVRFFNQEGESYSYRITSLGDDFLTLVRHPDEQVFDLTRSEDVDYKGNDFSKLLLMASQGFFVPPTAEAANQYLGKFIPDLPPGQRIPSVVLRDGVGCVFLLTDENGKEGHLAVFDHKETLTSFEKIYGDDKCLHTLKLGESPDRLIIHTIECVDGAKDVLLTIDYDGNIRKERR